MAINFNKAEFVLSSVKAETFIRDGRPQVTFAGRSNVGKSSVINRLLGRKNFARVGATPGKTSQINYFRIDDKIYFTDLPGYGYAKVSKEERDRWGRLMERYFAEEGLITLGVLIVDARHKPTADDVTMCDWFKGTGCPVIVVANKLDKLKKSQVEPALQLVRETLELTEADILLPFSAEKGENADELREQATQQDAWDKMQSEVYKRKTGLSETVIMHMMADTTYMTGREAIEKGFADELIEDAEPVGIAASADGRSLFVRGKQFHLAPGMFAPDNIPTVDSEAAAPVEANKNKPENPGEEGGNSMTLEELRAKYPDEIAQAEAAARAAVDHTEAVNAAVQAERERMQEIDEVASLLDPADVREAKYGEKTCTAADLVMADAKKRAKQGKKFLSDLKDDADESNAEDVGATPPPAEEAEEDDDAKKTPEARMADARAKVSALFGKKEG